MIAAGIRRGIRQYEVVPAQTPPKAQPERACLACMTDEMVRLCAMRVLYQGRKLSVEIFHALTDGYGGFTFLTGAGRGVHRAGLRHCRLQIQPL